MAVMTREEADRVVTELREDQERKKIEKKLRKEQEHGTHS